LRSSPPAGDEWTHEIKHDGYRLMVRRDGAGDGRRNAEKLGRTTGAPNKTRAGTPELALGGTQKKTAPS
jgi:hypothetical protein